MESCSYAAVAWETDSVDYVIAVVKQSLRVLRRIVPGSQSAIMLRDHYTWSAVAAIFFSNRIEDAGVTLSDTFTLQRQARRRHVKRWRGPKPIRPAAGGGAAR
ncbi:MAG: hypothetical protein WDW38_010307 [Sanguina aurantia]